MGIIFKGEKMIGIFIFIYLFFEIIYIATSKFSKKQNGRKQMEQAKLENLLGRLTKMENDIRGIREEIWAEVLKQSHTSEKLDSQIVP